MQKKLFVAPISALLICGLTACAQDKNAVNDRNVNRFQPVGYSTNDQSIVDHDGPLTELMDYSTGNVDYVKNNNRFLPSGYPDDYGPHLGSPMTQFDTNNTTVNKERHLRDINYHGQFNTRNSKARPSYYNGYEGRLSEAISNTAASVPNVTDARTIIDGKRVLIAVALKDENKDQATKRSVENAVLPYLNNRNYVVATNIGTYYRVRQLDNELRNGGPKDLVKLDADKMFESYKDKTSTR
ncbi:YhcN/YlaJ family sporulation lipoprotein [Bacillus sp. FJAT-49736]|uniref:YhcN/YlaJ family sporulation lipoprotein n=1 Tax=Bacillus sp. FJAT-49736 TaxID=2833582 RepID=UPI001BCA1CDA|nr:YhcN/YlaJ family sporulation lipoprotein [Bacillus sp. FJAT-49736]MBS4173678.1 YhcN/YlaJ family sporulation lipoprotein [Bacillus sp. FJAT-49736]